MITKFIGGNLWIEVEEIIGIQKYTRRSEVGRGDIVNTPGIKIHMRSGQVFDIEGDKEIKDTFEILHQQGIIHGGTK